MAIGKISSPIIGEVRSAYLKCRKNGMTRSEVIKKIRRSYAEELQDVDDRLPVLLGLTLALSKNHELIESLADEVLDEIRRLKADGIPESFRRADFSEIEEFLKDTSLYGEEAYFKPPSKYIPDWKPGDTFIHKLTYHASEELGISGWYIILYKICDFTDGYGDVRQLMCVSLCPPDRIPTCGSELEELGLLCMMYMDKPEYLSQLTIKSKRAENAYELTKIGNFPNIRVPASILEENHLTASPLFSFKKWTAPCPGYEDQICRNYKKYVLTGICPMGGH